MVSCSSSGDKESKNKPEYAQMRWAQRVDQQFRNPRDIKSSFTSKSYKADKNVKGGAFKTKEFAGSDKFRTKEYNTQKTSSWWTRKSKNSGQEYQDAEFTSPLDSKTYKTSQSDWATKQPWYARKQSESSGDIFKTRADPTVRKAQENSPRPYMLPESGESGYTEFDLQKFLKRN